MSTAHNAPADAQSVSHATTGGAHGASHATSLSSGGWSTRRIAILAMLCAATEICTFVLQFPILPSVTFLKYDPSGIIALIAGIAYGPAAGAVVSVLPYLVHLATESGIYGTIMAILATLSMVLPASLIIHEHATSVKGAIPGLIVGGIVSVVACILGNLVVTPLYTGMSIDAVAGLIIPALLPFNALKVIINGVVTTLLLRSTVRLWKMHAIDAA